MSIIGIILFSLFFLDRCNVYDKESNLVGKTYTFTTKSVDDAQNKVAWSIFISLYAISYAIVGTVYSFKKRNIKDNNITKELTELGELKEKGILTEEEFANYKNKLLNND